MTITGTLAQINAALGTLIYTPDKSFIGMDVLHIAVTDFGDPLDAFDTVTTDAYLGLFVGEVSDKK